MAQINLLKQKSNSQNFWEFFPSFLVKILAVFGVGVLCFYGWLFWSSGQIDQQILSTQQAIEKSKASASEVKDRDELLTRQVQLKELTPLINQHFYWSQLFPELARVTLVTTNYTSLKASSEGTIALSVTVPNLTELDKFLQVFDLPQFNKNFSDIKIGGFHKSQNTASTDVKFDVLMKYNLDLLKYANPGSPK